MPSSGARGAPYSAELVESDNDVRWSCSKTTRLGDTAFVYVAGIGVCFEWRVLSDAEKMTNGAMFVMLSFSNHLTQSLSKNCVAQLRQKSGNRHI